MDKTTFTSYMETYLSENDVNIAGDLTVSGTMNVTGTVTAGTLNNAEMTQLRSDNATLTSENETLTSANETLTSEKAALTTQNETLTTQNQTLTTANETLTSEKAALTTQNETLTTQNETLTSENETLTADKATLEARVAELEAGGTAPEGCWATIAYDTLPLKITAINNLDTAIAANNNSLANFFKGWDVSSFATQLSNLDVSAIRSFSFMFSEAKAASLDLSSWTLPVSGTFTTNGIFQNATITTLNISGWNFANENKIYQSWSGFNGLACDNLIADNVNISSLGHSTFYGTKVKVISAKNLTVGESMYNMFNYSTWLTSVDLEGLDTSAVTNFNNAFNYCSKLTSLGDVTFDLTSATNISYMFDSCNALGTNGVTLKFKNVPAAKWADEAALRTAASIPSGCVVEIENFLPAE